MRVFRGVTKITTLTKGTHYLISHITSQRIIHFLIELTSDFNNIPVKAELRISHHVFSKEGAGSCGGPELPIKTCHASFVPGSQDSLYIYTCIYIYMGVSKSSHFNRVFHYKPPILGYHYFWKHPYGPWPLFRHMLTFGGVKA